MKTIAYTLLLLLAFTSTYSSAQDLLPATSEDMAEFDRQMAKQLERDAKAKDKSNWGSEVSEEAKKLKDADKDQKNQFGKWVSSQRKKTDQGRPSAQGSVGNGRGNGNGPKNGKGPKNK